MKRRHWTQTPAGRARMSAIGKLKAHTRKEREHAADGAQEKDTDVAFALGFVTAWLETYASRAGVPASALAYRVGKLLQATARR